MKFQVECATEGCGKPAAIHFVHGEIGSWYCHDCYTAIHKMTHPALAESRTTIISDAPVAVCPICDIEGCHHIREARRAEFEAEGNARLQAEVAAMQAECGPDVMQVAAQQLAKLRAGQAEHDNAGLHCIIADIRAATVGGKPMLSELAQALVAWRDEAVDTARAQAFAEGQKAGIATEREACAKEAINQDHCGYPDEEGVWWDHDPAQVGREIAAAIRKRGEGKG